MSKKPEKPNLSAFGGCVIMEGVEWKLSGALSGSVVWGISEKGKIWCYRDECDIIFKISGGAGARRFALSKFAKNFDEYIEKKSEFFEIIARGLSKGMDAGETIKTLPANVCAREIPLVDEPFEPNIRGYSWKHVFKEGGVNFGLYDELWQTAEDKSRPRLKARLFEKSAGEFCEILSDEKGDAERKVSARIDNRFDAFERLKTTMREWTLAQKA